MATYTWNWYVQGNLVTSSPDFGHLWYLSVDMQAFVIMAAFLYMLRRRHVGLIFALVGFYLLLLWWRFHVAHTENDFQVLVRTTVRMDPFVVGVLAAVVLPDLARLRISARALAWTATGSLIALVPLLYWCDHDVHYLRWGGTVLEWDLAVFMVAVALGGGSAFLSAVIGNRVGDVARPQLPADLHLALPGVLVRRSPHEGRRLDLGGAHGGRHDGDGRDLRRSRPGARTAGGRVAAATRLARPRRRRTPISGTARRAGHDPAVRPRGLGARRPLGAEPTPHSWQTETGPLPLSTTRSVASLAEVATYTGPGATNQVRWVDGTKLRKSWVVTTVLLLVMPISVPSRLWTSMVAGRCRR